jgi:hypothetical protein
MCQQALGGCSALRPQYESASKDQHVVFQNTIYISHRWINADALNV